MSRLSAYESFSKHPNAISKYQFLRGVQERQEVLFYALVARHLEEMMPIIYTPTVGEAVANFSQMFQFGRGISLSTGNIHRAQDIVNEFPLNDVRLWWQRTRRPSSALATKATEAQLSRLESLLSIPWVEDLALFILRRSAWMLERTESP